MTDQEHGPRKQLTVEDTATQKTFTREGNYLVVGIAQQQEYNNIRFSLTIK